MTYNTFKCLCTKVFNFTFKATIFKVIYYTKILSWRVPVGSDGFENTSLNLSELVFIISKRSLQYIYKCKMLEQHFIELLSSQSSLQAENGTFIYKYTDCL